MRLCCRAFPALRAAPVLLLATACGSSQRAAPAEPRAAPPRAAERTAPAAESPPARATSECGELALERLGLIAEGMGERHPSRVAVEGALARCSDPRPSSGACARVLDELGKQQRRGYGPRHPVVVAATAKLELCRETFGPDGVPAPTPPTPDECAKLPAERERQTREGKGERHPAILAIDARLKECVGVPNDVR